MLCQFVLLMAHRRLKRQKIHISNRSSSAWNDDNVGNAMRKRRIRIGRDSRNYLRRTGKPFWRNISDAHVKSYPDVTNGGSQRFLPSQMESTKMKFLLRVFVPASECFYWSRISGRSFIAINIKRGGRNADEFKW